MLYEQQWLVCNLAVDWRTQHIIRAGIGQGWRTGGIGADKRAIHALTGCACRLVLRKRDTQWASYISSIWSTLAVRGGGSLSGGGGGGSSSYTLLSCKAWQLRIAQLIRASHIS